MPSVEGNLFVFIFEGTITKRIQSILLFNWLGEGFKTGRYSRRKVEIDERKERGNKV